METSGLKIHYLQHEPFEGIGCIANWASHNNYTVTGTKLYNNEALPNPTMVDMLVVMGGAMNIYEEAAHVWLQAEKKFIKQCIAAGKLMVGICLGAQLIADILGAKVNKNSYKEIGWYPITLTNEGTDCSLFTGLPKSFQVFHWHGDTFALPHGAIRLATSEACANQAFLYNTKVLGLQFHMEVTLESLLAMATEMDEELIAGGSYVQTVTEIKEGKNYIEACNAYMFTMLNRLVAGIK